MSSEAMGRKAPGILAGCVLAGFVLTTLALGSWWGFPVQDDNYMIRLLRRGGPDRIIQEGRERPISAFLIAGTARLAGERREPYILVGLACWSLFALLAVRFWRLLFPEWKDAWPAVALIVVSPLLAVVQFTTVTTLFQCLMPVLLVLSALVVLLGRSDDGARWTMRSAAALLAMGGAALSEYGVATAGAAGVFLLARGRWRGMLTLSGGVLVGYAVYRALGDIARPATNLALQFERLLSTPWTHPLRILSAAWYCVVGAWGRAISDLRIEWSSKSTMLAAPVALVVAAAAASRMVWRRGDGGAEGIAGRLAALFAAVVAGLAPAVVIQGWPLPLVYETRFMLPAVVFAGCATAAMLLALGRPEFKVLVVSALSFVAANRLVVQAFEEKRLQQKLEALGERVRPFVRETPGLLVLVWSDRNGQSAMEAMAKASYRWSLSEAERFWMIRPEDLDPRFHSREGCPDLASVRLPPRYVGWPRASDTIAQLMWDPGDRGRDPPAPYFPGCPSR